MPGERRISVRGLVRFETRLEDCRDRGDADKTDTDLRHLPQVFNEDDTSVLRLQRWRSISVLITAPGLDEKKANEKIDKALPDTIYGAQGAMPRSHRGCPNTSFGARFGLTSRSRGFTRVVLP